ncbi:hypothetical protein SDC9_122059 [bioreactor metagenome]|uniref:Uncharacterized protein n=1 Tax=bioreactor metagenome TaxID=1076179 RepID=A0A645CDU9_9ZZZZ
MENQFHRLGFFLIDDHHFIFAVIAEVGHSAGEHAAFSGASHLISDSFTNDLPLVLGKADQYVQHHASGTRRSVDFLCDRNKADVIIVKYLEQFGKIADRARKTVDFID